MTAGLAMIEKGTTQRESQDLVRLRDSAQRVAGTVFYAQMLKASQESKLKGAYGHGGRGEEIFAGQLHAVLAERMGTGTSKGLGDLLYDRLEHQQRLMTQLESGKETRP